VRIPGLGAHFAKPGNGTHPGIRKLVCIPQNPGLGERSNLLGEAFRDTGIGVHPGIGKLAGIRCTSRDWVRISQNPGLGEQSNLLSKASRDTGLGKRSNLIGGNWRACRDSKIGVHPGIRKLVRIPGFAPFSLKLPHSVSKSTL
jgi:hypothetical protein